MNEYSMSLIIEAEKCVRSASRILKNINHNFAFVDEAGLEREMIESVTAILDSVSESLYQKAAIAENK